MRTGRFGKGIAALLVAGLVLFSAGCFGKFQATRNVHDINKSVEQPYLRSAVTWVFVIAPVYGIAGLLDFFVFNVIEFWSGENPIAGTSVTKVYGDGEGRTVLALAREDAATTATIRRYEGKSLVSTLRVRDDGMGLVTAVETAGGKKVKEVVGMMRPDGSVDVTMKTGGEAAAERYSASAVRTQMVRFARVVPGARWAANAGRRASGG